MKERYKSKIAVYLLLIRNEDNKTEILLQKRYNTGYMDGFYDMACSGHVEKGESLADAIIRESYEEIGIKIDKEDLEFVNLLHRFNDDYINVFFKAKKYIGTPKIMEPNKCDDLNWFDINNLPDNVIPNNRKVIECIKKGILYEDGDFDNLNRN